MLEISNRGWVSNEHEKEQFLHTESPVYASPMVLYKLFYFLYKPYCTARQLRIFNIAVVAIANPSCCILFYLCIIRLDFHFIRVVEKFP